MLPVAGPFAIWGDRTGGRHQLLVNGGQCPRTQSPGEIEAPGMGLHAGCRDMGDSGVFSEPG